MPRDEEDFFLPPRDELPFLDELFDEPAFLGTFPPSLLASDKPIAMACLRLVTVLPLLPLFN